MPTRLGDTIVVLPRAYSDQSVLHSHARKMRDLRLRSLKTDPEAFTSSYEDESRKPFDFWTGRILNADARHFVICRPYSAQYALGQPNDAIHGEWLGILVLLGPREVDPALFSNETSWKDFKKGSGKRETDEGRLRPASSAYHMVGVFVAPEERRHGWGHRLVEAALGVIALDCEKTKTSLAICTVGADERNEAAQRLYQNTGFAVVAKDSFKADDGRHLTDLVMRRDLLFSRSQLGEIEQDM